MHLATLMTSCVSLLQMMKDVGKEQADRIFRSCDQLGNNKISLAEFKSTIQKGKEKLKP